MNDMNKRIAVIGAGNGGTAIAAHLALSGALVNLYDTFPEYTKDIQKEGGIFLEDGTSSTFAKMNMVTEDIGEAIDNVRIIMVVTPAFTHKMIADACYKYLGDGQIVVLNPGRTAGALAFLNRVRRNGCRKDIIVAETQTLIYSCRRLGPKNVRIYGVKDQVDIASLPADKVGEVAEALAPYYPQFKPTGNTLCTSLANIGSMFHPLPMLMNIGRVETDKRGFKYYKEGISPSVAAMIEKIDSERISVASIYGIKMSDAKTWLKKSYPTHGDDLYTLIQNNEAYAQIAAPANIGARYIKEDVPTGLVPISELGRAAHVATPFIDAVITLASGLYDRNFREEGRSLRNLGLEHMELQQIKRRFETGE